LQINASDSVLLRQNAVEGLLHDWCDSLLLDQQFDFVRGCIRKSRQPIFLPPQLTVYRPDLQAKTE